MTERFIWKNTPKIITYTNPADIDSNTEIKRLMNIYPHLCVSDTLLMGLKEKYKRSNFTFIATLKSFSDYLFNYQIGSRKSELQIFLDISREISKIEKEDGYAYYRAMLNNRGQMTKAFQTLALLRYEHKNKCKSKEEELFFKKIYEPLYPNYKAQFDKLENEKTIDDCRSAFFHCLNDEIEYDLGVRGKASETAEMLDALNNVKGKNENKINIYKEIIKDSKKYNIDTIIIHGVARFTPEIMMLIRTLDNAGIKIVFLINYAKNLPNIYGFWKKAYEWVGIPFENEGNLDLVTGNQIGRNIADICEGKRPDKACNNEIIRYSSITDFTDGAVRNEFMKASIDAEQNGGSVLSKMNTQYYSIDAKRPNEILKNYFPEQFIDKPFLSYPIGQFIVALFNMWDFNEMRMRIDFDLLKQCSLVKIAHKNSDMIQVVSDLKLYFDDLDKIEDIIIRIDSLIQSKTKLSANNLLGFKYLSFFAVEETKIQEFKKFIVALDNISNKIFGKDRTKNIDYQSKFKDLLLVVADPSASDNLLSEKENDLIKDLVVSLGTSKGNTIVGEIKELKDALMYFLTTKSAKSSADWIVRGFDQLDGAPLMKTKVGRVYELAMMSMKNMTKPTKDVLSWPLEEHLFVENGNVSLYREQMRNIVELRNDYLKFYFFYGSFFSKNVQIRYSYIDNDEGEKQRPYFLLELLGIPTHDYAEMTKKVHQIINDEKDLNKIRTLRISNRETNLFSICPYKYFLACVLKEGIKYTSDYHTLYFIKNEFTYLLELKCRFKKEEIEGNIGGLLKELKTLLPYLDEAAIADIKKYAKDNFKDKKRRADYLEKKRDFLIAQWRARGGENESENYMVFNKNASDIYKYLESSNLFPPFEEKPYNKICEECNFGELCLNYYSSTERKE